MRQTALRAVAPVPVAGTEPGTDLRDERVIRAAYDAHGPELYRFALRRLGDDGLAQETVQEVFVRAWRAAERFDPAVAGLRPWLFAIARNVVIDMTRRRAVRPGTLRIVPDVEEADDAQPFDEAMITSWVVEEALRRINPEQRVALVETYLRGRSYAEVSAELDVPAGTLRSRVFYGLKALRLALDEIGALDELGVQP